MTADLESGSPACKPPSRRLPSLYQVYEIGVEIGVGVGVGIGKKKKRKKKQLGPVIILFGLKPKPSKHKRKKEASETETGWSRAWGKKALHPGYSLVRRLREVERDLRTRGETGSDAGSQSRL